MLFMNGWDGMVKELSPWSPPSPSSPPSSRSTLPRSTHPAMLCTILVAMIFYFCISGIDRFMSMALRA